MNEGQFTRTVNLWELIIIFPLTKDLEIDLPCLTFKWESRFKIILTKVFASFLSCLLYYDLQRHFTQSHKYNIKWRKSRPVKSDSDGSMDDTQKNSIYFPLLSLCCCSSSLTPQSHVFDWHLQKSGLSTCVNGILCDCRSPCPHVRSGQALQSSVLMQPHKGSSHAFTATKRTCVLS